MTLEQIMKTNDHVKVILKSNNKIVPPEHYNVYLKCYVEVFYGKTIIDDYLTTLCVCTVDNINMVYNLGIKSERAKSCRHNRKVKKCSQCCRYGMCEDGKGEK